jgi:hypothetical protein
MKKNMIKKLPEALLFILISSISVPSCTYLNNGKCEQFRNGKFIFRPHDQHGDISFLITREDSIQTETEVGTEYYSKYRVHWIGDCKYELILLETSFPFPDSIQNIQKTVPFETEIITHAKEYYIFKSHRDGSIPMTDTMWVEKQKLQ